MRSLELEFSALLENAPLGILFTHNRMVVRANGLCAEMLRCPLDELIGKPASALWPDAHSYHELGRQAGPILASGQRFAAEMQAMRQDGSLFWCRFSAKAVKVAQEQDATLWFLEDTTEERLTLEALKRSTGELAAVFESDAIGMAIVVDLHVVRCNRKYEQLYGFEPGWLTGKSTRVLYPSDEEFSKRSAEGFYVLTSGATYRQDRLTVKADGTPLWLRVTGTALDQTDVPAGSVWLVEDITETREAEERARRVFEEQQMIFDNAAVGILFATRRKVARCNRRMASIFGFEPEELLGQSTRVFYASDDEYREAGIAGYATILAGDAFVIEMQVTQKAGRRVWVRATGRQVPLSTPGEDVVWIFEDVTERREAEAALQKAHEELEERVLQRTQDLQQSEDALRLLNADLEERVAQRTAALSSTISDLKRTQADLVQAEKLASLGSLVAGIAHELNTPLGNALVSASTLKDTMVKMQTDIAQGQLRRSALEAFLANGAEIADLVLRSSARAAELVSSFKQVAVDQTSEQRRIFELATLVNDVVTTIRPKFRHEPWVVEIDIPSGIQCDSYPGPLGQIVSNMVNNAIVHAFSSLQPGA